MIINDDKVEGKIQQVSPERIGQIVENALLAAADYDPGKAEKLRFKVVRKIFKCLVRHPEELPVTWHRRSD